MKIDLPLCIVFSDGVIVAQTAKYSQKVEITLEDLSDITVASLAMNVLSHCAS